MARTKGRKSTPPRGGDKASQTPASPWLARVLCALVLALLVAGLYAGAREGWRRIARRPEFALSSATLRFGECPPWVRPKPMAEELRRSVAVALQGAHIFDRELCERVRVALARRPWVREVRSVRRVLPNHLWVDVTFREPAGLLQRGREVGLVDCDGVPLPERLYRRPASWQHVMMPVIVYRRPGGTAGDEGPRHKRAAAVGARLTQFLLREGLLGELQIRTIDVSNVGSPGLEPQVTLQTNGGVLIKWGCTDAFEELEGLSRPPEEPRDEEKLLMLRATLARHPTFEGLRYIALRYNKVFFLTGASLTDAAEPAGTR